LRTLDVGETQASPARSAAGYPDVPLPNVFTPFPSSPFPMAAVGDIHDVTDVSSGCGLIDTGAHKSSSKRKAPVLPPGLPDQSVGAD
jgi:hypothetical protein